MILRVADSEHVVSVARIDESDDEVEIEAGDELAPTEDAVIGEHELDRPVDPEIEGGSE
jgi:DNA gyrase subunit A